MGIANLSELRTQIASWVNRTDLTTDQLSLFVSSAESDIRNDLEVREGRQTATGSISGTSFAVPSGFLYAETLTVDDYVQDFVPMSTYLQKQKDGYVSGYYTIEDSTICVLGGGSYSLHYFASLTALSDSSPSNWLLENSPNVYLWAGCKYASVFLRDAEGASGFHSLYSEAVRKLNSRETRAKFGNNLVVRPA
jgi:hypothetical protein